VRRGERATRAARLSDARQVGVARRAQQIRSGAPAQKAAAAEQPRE
jgi:hypothetical protein